MHTHACLYACMYVIDVGCMYICVVMAGHSYSGRGLQAALVVEAVAEK